MPFYDFTGNLDEFFDPFSLFPSDVSIWVVGGAVRDTVLKKDPHDWDLVVDLDIDVIRDLTGGSVVGPMGKQVCVFSRSGRVLEVAPMVGGSITADLSRRDFTVNAMALARGWSLVDPFGGRDDLALRRLRFVPEMEDRLMEDPVRAVRFCRFSATYGLIPVGEELDRLRSFVMENRTVLNLIHPQRIGREMIKGLTYPRAFFELLRMSGLKELVFPDLHLDDGIPLPDGPLEPSLVLALLSNFHIKKGWAGLLDSWGLPVTIKKETLSLGLVLSILSCPIGLNVDELCDLILRLGTSWIPRLSSFSELAFPCGGILRSNLAQVGMAATKLRDAEGIDIPLSGGSVASEIGPGPAVKPCLAALVRYVLSEEEVSLEGAKAVIRQFL